MRRRSTCRTRRDARVVVATVFAAIVAAALAGCAPVPSRGSCEHYANGARALENVPDCELSGPHRLINGLPPAHPWNHA